jgi:hypothetical protein
MYPTAGNAAMRIAVMHDSSRTHFISDLLCYTHLEQLNQVHPALQPAMQVMT